MLNDTATKIGVYLTALGTTHRFYQGDVRNPLLSSKPLEPGVLQNLHRHLP
ncbi:hypothetical protein CES86_4033 [Brucella lupini]|uniref:Uncharacterized protein n=2 Tax=Brucella TaxID=234 RepID=A0A256G733_9HYPH|nr:hypothetical protein CEV34_4152 [Brucella pseudogrignonensis]OYR25979.1 hypothetical protein CES86_4033 [Brucella lupini]